MTDDRALYQWTVELEETGIFLVKDAVPNEDSIDQLAQRVAHLRRTNYGFVHCIYIPQPCTHCPTGA